MQKAGHYPPPHGVPEDQPGLECAGVVEATGATVRRFVPGDRVMGLLPGAAQAELALLDERVAMPVPTHVLAGRGRRLPGSVRYRLRRPFPPGGLTVGDRALVTGAGRGRRDSRGPTSGGRRCHRCRQRAPRRSSATGSPGWGRRLRRRTRHWPLARSTSCSNWWVVPGCPRRSPRLAPRGRLVVIGVGAVPGRTRPWWPHAPEGDLAGVDPAHPVAGGQRPSSPANLKATSCPYWRPGGQGRRRDRLPLREGS